MGFQRYVALGDSTTEGLDDHDGAGGYRGWADRLAERIAATQGGSLLYANLGVRGRSAREIRHEQLARAVAMRPDLATVVGGMNDLLRGDFDPVRIAGHVGEMQRALVDQGAVVVSFTLPDVSIRMPIRGALTGRTAALNHELRTASARSGALLVDLSAFAVASDPRLWSADRLHLNTEGHARTADALAARIAIPGVDDWWSQPLPPSGTTAAARIVEDLAWGGRYVAPWLWRRLRGRNAGDRRTAKRPELTPVVARG